jgi:hypothetical protein
MATQPHISSLTGDSIIPG